MTDKPEEKAREEIDRTLEQCGWEVQDRKNLDLTRPAVACREFSTDVGPSDYLLIVDQRALGVVEAKPEGHTLTGVERQTEDYAKSLPDIYNPWHRPLPFVYQSTGSETRFTNLLDPNPRSREVFAFHRPKTLLEWVIGKTLIADNRAAEKVEHYTANPSTLLSRIQDLPPLIRTGLWEKQVVAIEHLEKSLKANKQRALIQMATGSGKTFTAITAAYRLIKFAGARRVLFLVDRKNLGDQADREFGQYTTPDDGRKFKELFNTAHLTSNNIAESSRVCIATIQRVYSILKGEPELDPETEELSTFEVPSPFREPLPVVYNEKIPPEAFDFIIIDECHRSIYKVWRQVLEYFDAYLIGLTATPSKQTVGFFHGNQIMDYSHEQAVADGVNVDFTVFQIRTKVTGAGSRVEAGNYIIRRDRRTRRKRLEELDQDFTYEAKELDRSVVAPDQVRMVLQTFRDQLPTQIFPGRREVPKTLIFAKDDSHADLIVDTVREVFGQGNDFCQKITYRTSRAKEVLKTFTNSFNPRIAVTVDMVATGTDIKPVEIIFFMRSVASENYFEQMKGRGVRIIKDDDLKQVTPSAQRKTHFVIVDAVGVCESERQESRPLERKPSASFDSLLQAVAQGSKDPDVVSSLVARMSKMVRDVDPQLDGNLRKESGGLDLRAIVSDLLEALSIDEQEKAAAAKFGSGKEDFEATEEQLNQVEQELVKKAVTPLLKPKVRKIILEIRRQGEQVIDEVTQDQLLHAGFSEQAKAQAQRMVRDFEKWLADNKEEIEALKILYSVPYRRRLTFEAVRELAKTIERPPRSWTPQRLWDAYEKLDRDRVKGRAADRQLADVVSIIRYALKQEPILEPFSEHVRQRYENWLAQQQNRGRKFSTEQRQWLELIRDTISEDVAVNREIFDQVPFNQKGVLAKAAQLFGDKLDDLLEELNVALVA